MASCKNGTDPSEYATTTTNEYIEYLKTMQQDHGYKWDYLTAIENQIRIIRGFIDCYDRPIVRDKITNKTRWTV